MSGKKRTFETGATRDVDDGKIDYEGFLSPLVLEEYGGYMCEHQTQSDGTRRDSDNWQKGIPMDQYIKSMFRHFMTVWRLHRGWSIKEEMIGGVMRQPTMKDALSGLYFNVQGYFHEWLKLNDK